MSVKALTILSEASIKKNVDTKTTDAKTADKINKWAVAGRIFFSLALMGILIASGGFLGLFTLSNAIPELLLGSSSLLLIPAVICLFKFQTNQQTISSTKIKGFFPSRASFIGKTGITNKGNDCFTNSMLQLMNRWKSLQIYIQGVPKGHKLYKFKEFFSQLNKDEVAKKDVTKAVSKELRTAIGLSASRQEDPDEFLRLFGNLIDEDAPMLINATETKFYENENHEIKTCDPITAKHLPDVKICIDKDKSFQEQFDLTFYNDDPNSPDGINVSEIEEITAADGDVGYREVVKNYPVVMETKQFANAPNQLLVEVKRFDYSNGAKKIIDDVDVPLRLELNEKHLKSRKKTNYKLVGIIEHLGSSPRGGHYISYIEKDGLWFECNDSHVYKMTSTDLTAKRKQGYIYLFEKI